MRADVAHPLREIRRRIHRQRQGVPLAHGDVHKLEVALLSQIRQSGRGIKRGPDDGDRMGEQFDSALSGRRGSCGLRPSITGLGSGEEPAADVVRDIAVECFAGAIEPELPDRRRKDEIHLQALLHPCAPVLEINGRRSRGLSAISAAPTDRR